MDTCFQAMVIRSVFKDRSVGGSRTMNARLYHGFIMKIQGETEYSDGENTFLISPGDILFVPQNACYAIREVSPGYSCVVNFDGCPGWSRMQLLPKNHGLDVTAIAEKLHAAWQKEEHPYTLLGLLYGLLGKALSAPRSKEYLSPGERKFLTPVMDYLQEKLTDPNLQIGQLAEKAGVSDTYLRRIFKKKYGLSPAGYITRERLRLAKALLEREEGQSIQAVATQVGFRDPLYFSRIFRKQYGLSPTDYCKEFFHDIF